MLHRAGALCAALLPLLACGPKDLEPPAAAPVLGDTPNPTGLLAEPHVGLQLATEPYELSPGREDGPCWYVNLNNEEALDVVRMQTASHPILHHFNIFSSTLEKEDGWGRCPDSIELFVGARPIIDGSGAAVDYVFPEGIAVRLEPKTLIIFQLHSINTATEPKPQQFVLNLHTEPGVDHTLADIYGFTNLGLELPPEQVSAHPKDCNIEQGMWVMTMSSHMHARAIEAKAELIRGGGAPELLYRTERWDDPEVKTFDPPRYFDVGDVVRFSCTYDNKDARVVKYGPDADDEMCFVFGYYYPKQGLVPCF